MTNSQKTNLIHVIFFGISISLILVSNTLSKVSGVKTQSIPLYPIPQIEHFAFGYQENLADSFWLRAIQDFDFCEKKLSKGRCESQKGWLYQMLFSVTKLSPEFKMPLLIGPVMLSVVVGDIEGASVLFDYAVEKFPNDWSIAYRAGYHALFEEKNNAKAARLMEQAARNGAPGWVYNLATKLYSKAGEQELAHRLYLELLNSGNFNPEWLKEMRTRLGVQE